MKSFCEKLHILRNGFVFFFFFLGCTEVAFAAGQEMSMRGGWFSGMSMIYGILAGISLMLLSIWKTVHIIQTVLSALRFPTLT